MNGLGLVTLPLDDTVYFNGEPVPDEHHRWNIDDVEQFVGPTGTINRKLSLGTHIVALRHLPAGVQENVTITVVPML